MDQFPLDIGLTELRGIIKIIKDNNNTISLSKLAAEAGGEIDTLLPLLNAGRLLNLLTINNGLVTVTESGKALNIKNIANIIGTQLALLEPFKTILEALKEGNKTTDELVAKLDSSNISLNVADPISGLRTLLIKWGVRAKLVSYNRKEDKWSIYKMQNKQ
ncbi:MAG: AAA-associated domain-containing protein [Candidatus Micrarchaeia archaeon]